MGQRGVGARDARLVGEHHVVGHDEHGVDDRREVADLHQSAVPAGGPRVGVDRDLGVRPLGVHLLRQLGHEGREAGLDVGIRRARALSLEVDVDAVDVLGGDGGDRVVDRQLGQGGVGDEAVDRLGVELLDHDHDAVAVGMRAVDHVGEGGAVPLIPARRGGVEDRVTCDREPEVGEGAEEPVVPS